MGVKDILAWTNPIAWVCAVPFVVGIVIGVIFKNVGKDTCNVLKSLAEESE